MCVTSTFGFDRRFERAVKLEVNLIRGVVTLCASCHEKLNNSERKSVWSVDKLIDCVPWSSSASCYRASGTEPGIQIALAVLNATRMGQCAVVSQRPADKTRKKLDNFSKKQNISCTFKRFQNFRWSFLADLGNTTTRNVFFFFFEKMDHS